MLTVRETMMLDFERSWWMHQGAKDEEIREQFGMTSVRYYAVLNGLIDRPEALAHDPMVVRRLRRLRERRAATREWAPRPHLSALLLCCYIEANQRADSDSEIGETPASMSFGKLGVERVRTPVSTLSQAC